MGENFFRKLDMVEIRKVKPRVGEPPRDDVGVRAYCYSVHTTWLVQVRGYLSLADGRRSDAFVCASAYLDPDALYEFRDALDRLIAEHECGPDPIAGIERASDYKLLQERKQIEIRFECGPGSAVVERLEARRRAIDVELARRARNIADAEERVRYQESADKRALTALDSLISQLVAVRDAARGTE